LKSVTRFLSNKIVIVILSLIVLAYLLFIALPIVAVFLKIDLSQLSTQLQNPQII